jgi:aryl-alcohol dehydrogenase-like predicted oxidoreductase
VLELDNLSRIGFGCYRVTVDSQSHYDALLHALASGCNLIDTASTYAGGKSEELVGRVLQDSQREAFVVTKAGYVPSALMAQELSEQIPETDVTALPNGAYYSINPDFLRLQIGHSQERLKRRRLDGFLLHNPEHFFDDERRQFSPDEYYERIKRAFEFLEDQVVAGELGYYGVSSNTFPLPVDQPTATDLRVLLRLARDVAADNHFRLVEFPLNLAEMGVLERRHGETSLVSLAETCGITMLSNRPLTAFTPRGVVRLAEYDVEPVGDDAGRVFEACWALLRRRLDKLGLDDALDNFPVIRYLAEHWKSIGNPEAVDTVFGQHFFPFLDKLYEGDIPKGDLVLYRKLYTYAVAYSRRALTLNAIRFRDGMIARGLIDKADGRPLPLLACDYYLRAGVDHVLVGMRRPEYVDQLRSLF